MYIYIAMVDQLPISWMVIPPLIGNPLNGYINTTPVGLMTIPYHMEIIGVFFTPAHIWVFLKKIGGVSPQIIHFHRVLYMKTSIYIYIYIMYTPRT